jgi:hypothetical protein
MKTGNLAALYVLVGQAENLGSKGRDSEYHRKGF